MKKLSLILFTISLWPFALAGQDRDVSDSFLLGGLLYAGELPINNPENTGDIGVAYLYRLEGNLIIPEDTVVFDSLGYFFFEQVRAGYYFIKAGLAPGSMHSNFYLPTYFGEEAVWERADTIWVNSNNYDLNIRMLSLEPYLMGSCKISGFLTFENLLDSPLPPCEVILATTTGVPAAYTFSGPAGTFTLNDIPYGEYVLTADVTGSTAQKIPISLSEGKPQAEGVEIRLHSGPQGILIERGKNLEIDIFPNPTPDLLNLRIWTLSPKVISAILTDLTGIPLLERSIPCPKGESREIIDLSSYAPGTYLLKLIDLDSKEITTKKVLHR